MIEIKTLDKPLNTPLVPLITQASAELCKQGYSDPSGSQVGWDSKVVYAEDEGTIVGFICWSPSEWIQEAIIGLGYVLPEYRRQGIYGRMFDVLEKEATALKLRSISGYTSAKNLPLQKAAIKQGRELVSFGFRKQLSQAAEPIKEDKPKKNKVKKS